MSEILVTDKALCGFMAMWVCRQHPYNSVDGVDAVNEDIRARAVVDGWIGNDELRMHKFADANAICRWLKDAVEDHPQMKIWNTPKIDSGAPFHFVSRYSTHNPECDFIDIGALLRNVAMDAWREAERHDEFDKRFEAELGPVS